MPLCLPGVLSVDVSPRVKSQHSERRPSPEWWLRRPVWSRFGTRAQAQSSEMACQAAAPPCASTSKACSPSTSCHYRFSPLEHPTHCQVWRYHGQPGLLHPSVLGHVSDGAGMVCVRGGGTPHHHITLLELEVIQRSILHFALTTDWLQHI